MNLLSGFGIYLMVFVSASLKMTKKQKQKQPNSLCFISTSCSVVLRHLHLLLQGLLAV